MESVREKPSLSALPVELHSEIFVRLPVRSLLSCQCVCKSFDTLIRSPKFIASHVNRNATSSTNTFCSLDIRVIDENYNDSYEHVLIDKKDDNVFSTSHVRQSNPITTDISVLASCNGLFCAELNPIVKEQGCCIMLWNPVTRQNRYLPISKIKAPDMIHYPVHAFGFVPESNDYKVVRILLYYTSGRQDSPTQDDVFVVQIEVYKMSTDFWNVFEAKSLPCHGPDFMSLEINPFLPLFLLGTGRSLFLEGAFHWLADNPKNIHDTCAAVVAFDLKDEDMKLICVLKSHRILHAKHGQLDIVNDLLGLIVPHNPGDLCSDVDIWVMNDYGNGESWSKQYSVENFTGLARHLGYWKDNLVVMNEIKHRSLFVTYIQKKGRKFQELGISTTVIISVLMLKHLFRSATRLQLMKILIYEVLNHQG